MEVEGTGPSKNGRDFTVETVRRNPADPGAVTGSATYASFYSSLLRAILLRASRESPDGGGGPSMVGGVGVLGGTTVNSYAAAGTSGSIFPISHSFFTCHNICLSVVIPIFSISK